MSLFTGEGEIRMGDQLKKEHLVKPLPSPWPGMSIQAGELMLVQGDVAEEFAFSFGVHAMKHDGAKLLVLTDSCTGDSAITTAYYQVAAAFSYERYREALYAIVPCMEECEVYRAPDYIRRKKGPSETDLGGGIDIQVWPASRKEKVEPAIGHMIDKAKPSIVIITNRWMFSSSYKYKVSQRLNLKDIAVAKNVAIIVCRGGDASTERTADTIVTLQPIEVHPQFDVKIKSRRLSTTPIQLRHNKDSCKFEVIARVRTSE